MKFLRCFGICWDVPSGVEDKLLHLLSLLSEGHTLTGGSLWIWSQNILHVSGLLQPLYWGICKAVLWLLYGACCRLWKKIILRALWFGSEAISLWQGNILLWKKASGLLLYLTENEYPNTGYQWYELPMQGMPSKQHSIIKRSGISRIGARWRYWKHMYVAQGKGSFCTVLLITPHS